MSSKSKKQLERYGLPTTIDGICALIRQTLENGHVHRLEMDNDDAYVRVWRWVEKQDLEEPDVTLDGALRNMESFTEYSSDGASAFQVLVDMMLLCTSKGLKPTCWVIGLGGHALLQQWLLLDERDMPLVSCATLLGRPAVELKSIPTETLILCCSDVPDAEPSEITLVIKTTVDVRGTYVEDSIQGGRVDDRGGDSTKEYSSAVNPLAHDPRELRRVPWKTQGQLDE